MCSCLIGHNSFKVKVFLNIEMCHLFWTGDIETNVIKIKFSLRLTTTYIVIEFGHLHFLVLAYVNVVCEN